MRIIVLFLLVLMPNYAWATTTCSTQPVGQISDVIYDGESKQSAPGTVSNGTIIIDSNDLKRKQCNNGQWITLRYDGKNATSIDPWAESHSEHTPLNATKRNALSSIGRVSCGHGGGTGFLLNLEEYGAELNRDYDIILTSCHVIKNATCAFYPRQTFRKVDPQIAINNNRYQMIYAQPPIQMSQTKSGQPCSEIFNGRVSKKDARKDWVFVKLDKHVTHIADQNRIIIQPYNGNRIENIAKRGELFVIGAPPQDVTYQGKTFSIYDIVYSKECKAKVHANNLVHTCISFPGMSGGPTGYFSRDDSFVAVGINSWSSEMRIPLHKKKAGQIRRGAATAIDDEQINALKSFIRELER